MNPSHRADSGFSSDAERIVQSRLLAGRYALDAELGRGGMAVVWVGTDQRLGRTVAVKTLRSELATDETVQARFRREAQSAAALNHSSVVAVYDTGEEVLDGVSVPYIVMEYVEGRTLRDELGDARDDGQRMPPGRALEIIADVLEALEYSHRAGIIHRDIKPANVMLTPAGKAKVMDFGIARAMADASANLTQTAAVLGTAQYLSPEQARSEPVDARSDIYSSGCLLYELLTGRPPFVGDPVSVVYQHVQEEPQPPSTLQPQVSAEAESITLKALRKDPLDRYQSAAQMRADVDLALAGHKLGPAPPRPQEATPPPLPPTTTMPSPTIDGPDTNGTESHHGRTRPRMRWYAFAAVVLVVLGAAAAVGSWMFGGRTDTVAVPTLTGTTTTQARMALDSSQLELGKTSLTASDEVPKGQIIAQHPEPAHSAAVGSTVDVTVSSGKPKGGIPDVIGERVAQARTTLETSGFRVRDLEDTDSRKPAGEVTRVDPPGGSVVPKGSLVTLYHSTGLISVPNVRHRNEAEAQAILTAAGFKVNKIPQDSADADPGTVTFQIPEPGTHRSAGTRVSIVVAHKPKRAPTPTPEPIPSPAPTSSPVPPPGPSPTPSPSPTGPWLPLPDLPGPL
ncbi:Stk1 family PASTA domain-containing Ser/Thr kinase [Actinopolymorpha pittospori]|uniref:non-specific serine/threonine protein kinase n=1 Tax=Actinopolymorpha pittospori TaxID=648752 RepID=A0A927MVU1_9ACTN|nr:Stk1 family PASTA domain-containing Ser/Thr kinase [Actinopolymorpha pittospori]MBE1604225.1 serine/threonine-protein kinase [Actinopolymorpha pittospori]